MTPRSEEVARQRAKVQGAVLEAKFDRWADRTRHRTARSFSGGGLARTLLSGALVVGLAWIGVAAGQADGDHRAAMRQHQDRIEQLETSLAAGTSQPGETSAEAMAEVRDGAATAAVEVARLQQRYAQLFTRMPAARSGDGAPGQAMRDVVAHRRSLARWWTQESLVVPGRDAYRFTTLPVTGPDQIDPRFAWYVHDGRSRSGRGGYRWQVEAVTPRIADAGGESVAGGTARVVWVCRDTSPGGPGRGAVLAWASATYHHNSGVFSDLAVVTTDARAQQVPADAQVDNDDGSGRPDRVRRPRGGARGGGR